MATTHGDLIEDFQPDIVIDKGFQRDIKVTKNDYVPRRCSIQENISIEKGKPRSDDDVQVLVDKEHNGS